MIKIIIISTDMEDSFGYYAWSTIIIKIINIAHRNLVSHIFLFCFIFLSSSLWIKHYNGHWYRKENIIYMKTEYI